MLGEHFKKDPSRVDIFRHFEEVGGEVHFFFFFINEMQRVGGALSHRSRLGDSDGLRSAKRYLDAGDMGWLGVSKGEKGVSGELGGKDGTRGP